MKILRGYMMKKIYTYILLLIGTSISAQSITVQADKYLHIFEGAGVSIGLYMGHHWSMDEANRDKAIRLINKDCNMLYLQDYVNIYPSDDPGYYDRRADYIKAAKVYRPEIKVSMVGNKFPKDLMHDSLIGGVMKPILNTEDPLIYTKVANWFFQLFKGFKDRGVDVDILNVVNEPDWDKKFYYGQSGNTEKAVSLIFTQAVPKFKEMLLDTTINKGKMKIPKIMGPSTLDPNACLNYLRYFKLNYPQAWAQIDIVATHQYNNGVNETMLKNIAIAAEGKPYFQSEMHTNRGDNLGALPLDEPHRGALSLASLFGAAVRNGVSSWFYFENNYPNEYTPAGLIHVAWQSSNPVPYKHYYAFKQLTSAQPAFSHVIERTLVNLPQTEITTFRKKGEDTIYIHASNFAGNIRSINLNVQGIGTNYVVKSYTTRTTDATNNDVFLPNTVFQEPVSQTILSLSPYSVNTFKIVLKKEVASAAKDISLENYVKIAQMGDKIVVFSTDKQLIQSVSVHSVMGQLLENKGGFNNEMVEIDGVHYPSGVYLFTVKTDKGQVVKKAFISHL
jgi:hypothetical protein